jgi:putative transposase
MIDRSHDLSVARQAELLDISRGSVYYLPRPTPPSDLALMRRIDELHLDYPFAGARMLQGLLKREGFEVGRLHVRTLMRKMGIEAIYRRPNTSKPEPGHKIFPYLLRNVPVTQPNQVWAMDITYVPMARGFVYLAAVVDWFSRRVLAWRVSISMDASFYIEAVEGEADRGRRPRKPPNTGALRQASDLQHGSGQPRRTQSIVATRCLSICAKHWSSASAGVVHASALRGRALCVAATAASASGS